MSSSYAYTQTYVQLKILFIHMEKAEGQDVYMPNIIQKQAQKMKYK